MLAEQHLSNERPPGCLLGIQGMNMKYYPVICGGIIS